jgi:hypothetical protein
MCPYQEVYRPISPVLSPISFSLDTANPPKSTEPVNWINEYEQKENSIFKFYNVDNEVKFIKSVEQKISSSQLKTYLEENIYKFIDEFVGKIPYTSIPYQVDSNGISYAGMQVMDSYKKAAMLGGERERDETQGFQTLAETYTEKAAQGEQLPTSVWISPPKDAKYGFAFVFIPGKNGFVNEYIVRYPESLTSLETSNRLYTDLVKNAPTPQSTSKYLRTPIFDLTGSNANSLLDTVLRSLKVDENAINQSIQFKEVTRNTLHNWVSTYTDLIQSLTLYEEGSKFYQVGIMEAKKLLLAIYQKAQEIKTSLDISSFTPQFEEHISSDPTLSRSDLYTYALGMQQQTSLPTAEEGSCPAFQDTTEDPFGRPILFMDSLSILTNLNNGLPVKKVVEKDTFTCPKCGYEIPAGKGINKCPNCQITSQQYAEETGVKCV